MQPTPQILLVGQNEGLFRTLCALVELKRTHVFSVLVCIPQNACNSDTIDVACFARKCGWKTCTTDCTETSLLEIVGNFRPSLLGSVLFPKRIAPSVLNAVPAAINFHPSLLPEHRGSLTQFWAVFDGDTRAGVTCHHMVSALDQGAIIDHVECSLDPIHETAFSLNRKLMTCVEALAKKIFKSFLESGQIPPGIEQQSPETPYHFRKFPNDGFIDATWPIAKIDRFIRAMFCPPYAGAKFRRSPDSDCIEVQSLEEYERLATIAASSP